jgi:uncharacterized protein
VPLLAVSAHDLDTAGFAVDADLPLAWLEEQLGEAELTGVAPGHITARLSRSGNDVVVRGKVTADLRAPCARCLEPATLVVDTELTLLLQPAHASGGHGAGSKPRPGKPGKDDDEYEFSAAEADVDTFDGETVVLDPFVREAILLEAPSCLLCREDCPGIRPAAAPAKEVPAPRLDPRLAPLGALRDKLSPKPKKE